MIWVVTLNLIILDIDFVRKRHEALCGIMVVVGNAAFKLNEISPGFFSRFFLARYLSVQLIYSLDHCSATKADKLVSCQF